MKRRTPHEYLESIIEIRTSLNPPSIPNKFQSYGYDEADNGMLILQDSVRQGYTGLHGNAVGPGDYDPDLGAVKGHTMKPNFSKVCSPTN